MRFPGLVGGSLSSRSPIADCEETWNWYVEPVESQHAKASPVLYPTPGFTPFVTLPEGPIRGLWAQDNRAFAVAGAGLYEIFSDGVYKARPQTQLPTPIQPVAVLSPPIDPLLPPDLPVIYPQGVGGGTTFYAYRVTALTAIGETSGSPTGSTTNAASLNTVDYNVVTWGLRKGATGYKVYRVSGGVNPPRLIGTIANPTQSTFADQGQVGEVATVPETNTTGSKLPDGTYSWAVVAKNYAGTTLPSLQPIYGGYPKLDQYHYFTLTWPEMKNATGYDVYRTKSPAITPEDPSRPVIPADTLLLIGSLVGSASTTLKDTGQIPPVGAPAAVLPTANTTLAAGFAGGTGPVSISSSGDAGRELFICAGGVGYVFDLDTSSLTAVVGDVATGGFIDGWFVALDAATSTLKMSNYLDGLAWDPTQIAQRNIAGDKWRGMIVIHREIWLFGEQTSEVWSNVGASPFPFAPNQNVFIEAGTAAIHAPLRIGQELLWLGQDPRGVGVVFRPRGYNPERVSNHALETALQHYSYIADAEAFGYQQDGHSFYIVSFPTANATWAFDVTTGEWAQRGVWNTLKGRFDVYRARCHCYAFGGIGKGWHLVGDRASGVIYSMTLDTGTEIGGGVIRRVRRAPHLHADAISVAYRRLQVDIEVGLGFVSDPQAGPQMMLRWSDDGSKTWSNEHWMSAGALGKYRWRVRWSRLGAARDRVFEVVCTDGRPWRVIDAYLEIEPGAW